jgi:ketosteroid isomerase-like protein
VRASEDTAPEPACPVQTTDGLVDPHVVTEYGLLAAMLAAARLLPFRARSAFRIFGMLALATRTRMIAMKRLSCLAASLALLLLAGVGPAGAQTPDQDAAKAAVKAVFAALDSGDTARLEKLFTADAVVFDSTYPLRVDGWEEFKNYLADMHGLIKELKTSIRQPQAQVLGAVAVVSFYYSQDYVAAEKPPQPDTSETDDVAVTRERTNEAGRGTVVLVGDKGAWKVASLHLSQFPASMF